MAASIWSAIVHTCHLPSWMCKIHGIAHSRTRIFNEYQAQELQPIRSIKKRNTVFLPYSNQLYVFTFRKLFNRTWRHRFCIVILVHCFQPKLIQRRNMCTYCEEAPQKLVCIKVFGIRCAHTHTHTNFLSIVLIIIIIVLVFVLPLCWGWNDVARHLMRNEFSNRNTGNTWAVSGGSAKKVHHRISERSIHWFNEKAGANYTTCAQ